MLLNHPLFALVEDLKTVPGIRTIVIGGSRARGINLRERGRFMPDSLGPNWLAGKL